ncbi:MAG: PAS domain S-box protein, partial [Rhodospirillaceae bacterium]
MFARIKSHAALLGPAAPPLPVAVALLAVVAFCAGWIGTLLSGPGNLSPFWLASGVGVAAVLWCGPWLLAGLCAGCFAANLNGGPYSSAAALALELGLVVEVALVALVVRRWGGGAENTATLRGTLALLGGAALVGCPLGAALGVLGLSAILPGPIEVDEQWLRFWLGDAAGILLVAPVALQLRTLRFRPLSFGRMGWWLVFFGVLAALDGVLFLSPRSGAIEEVGDGLTYLLFPFVAVAGLWLGPLGVAAATGLTMVLALGGTVSELGPFIEAPVAIRVMLFLIYAIAMTVTGYVLAAVRHDREQAIRAMTRSTEQLMAAERLAGIGWWQIDDLNGERAWSEGMFHVLGIAPGGPIPARSNLLDLVVPADQPLFDRYRSSLPALADGDGIEFRVRLPDGTERWLVCRHTVASEKPSGYFGIIKDITDQKRQTLALYESEQTLRRVFDQSPLGVALVSRSFRFLRVNQSLCRLTGYSAEELLVRSVADITHPEDIGASFAEAPALLAGAIDQLVIVKRYLRKDGAVLWINLLARPIRDESGHTLYYVSMMEDITERRRTEAALAEAKLAAEQSSRAKTGFLAATSHDLRQPLMAANLFLESLLRRFTGDDRPPPELERVRQALAAMTEMLDVLLDLSQLETGIVRAERRPIALGRLLADLARTWSEVAAARGLELRAVPTSAIVDTDPVLLKRILRNLLDNAVKYTAGGRILLGCRRGGGEVRVQVVDTGVGIPADKLEAIFGEFYQIDNPNRDRARGLGMGLSIVDRLAAALASRLAVRSRPGHGSCF